MSYETPTVSLTRGSTAGQAKQTGEREVKKARRRTLFKYKLHQDADLFDRAYGYIREYY